MYNVQKVVGGMMMIGIGAAMYTAHVPTGRPTEDIIAQIQHDIHSNDKRIDMLLASQDCRKFVPDSYHCAKIQAELAGLRAQNFSLKTSIIAIQGKNTFNQLGQKVRTTQTPEQPRSVQVPQEVEVRPATVGGGLRKVGEGAGDVIRGIGQGISNVFK